MHQEIGEIIAKVNTLLAEGGGRVELVEAKAGSLVVRFDEGESADCERCVIATDGVKMLLEQAVARQLPSIDSVQVISGSRVDGRS